MPKLVEKPEDLECPYCHRKHITSEGTSWRCRNPDCMRMWKKEEYRREGTPQDGRKNKPLKDISCTKCGEKFKGKNQRKDSICPECQKKRNYKLMRKWRAEHPEYVEEQFRKLEEWGETHKDRVRGIAREKYAADRKEVLDYFKKIYGYPYPCQGKWHKGKKGLTDEEVLIDHTIPLPRDLIARGGREKTWNNKDNLKPFCKSCNGLKAQEDEAFREEIEAKTGKPYREWAHANRDSIGF